MLVDSKKFYASLSEVLSLVNQSSRFEDGFPLVEHALLRLFGAQRVTVYQRSLASTDIFSRFKSGDNMQEIRVPVSTTSISGYVAFSRKALRIADVSDEESLQKIHPNLRHNSQIGKATGFVSKQMLVVPIVFGEVLLGVIQFINCVDKPEFDEADLEKAQVFAQRLGHKFRSDFGCTEAPFDYLIQNDLIEAFQLQQLEKAAGSSIPLTRLLRNETQLSTEQIGRSLECYYQVPFVAYEPERYSIHPVCDDIKLSYLRSNNLVLLSDGDSQSVILLTDNPNDTARIISMEHLLGTFKVRIAVGLQDDIHQYLGMASLGFDSKSDDGSDVELVNAQSETLADDLEEDDYDAVQVVNRLLADARRWQASDIHIEPGEGHQPTRVRMRIDGSCQESIQLPSRQTRAVISRIKVMANMDIADRRLPQDGKFSVRIQGQLLELRVATIPTVSGESMVMRLLQSGEPIPFHRLGLSTSNARRLDSMMKIPHGLLLVVGPTGSGKTTTLHALLSRLNTPDRKIWTAEDPVEITQSGLMQVQVSPKIGLTFASALRSFLRADPDVILIGEMRDRETAKAAVDASLTGHLVLSTLHTNSAAETISRLLALGLDPDNFSDALIGVVAQRLVRTLCKECKTAYQPDGEEVELLNRRGGGLFSFTSDSTLYRPSGCSACNNTGYKGRVAIHEVLASDETLRTMINEQADTASLVQHLKSQGMHTLMQDGIAKIQEGEIDYVQLQRVTADY
ncbi:MAG: GspE/PulE family protein [Pontibacterium sp.]